MADVAEVRDKPNAVLPEVPTQITAPQVIAFLLALAAIHYGRGFLAPLLVAILAAVALAPPVRQLSRVMPRWFASALVVLAITGAVGFTAWVLSDEVAAFSRRLPAIVRDVREVVQSASPRQGVLRQLQQAVTELEETTAAPKPRDATPVQIVQPVDVQRQVMTGARRAGDYLIQAVLLLFLVYFLLASGDMFLRKLVTVLPRFRDKKQAVEIAQQVQSDMSHYLFTVTVINIVLGLAVGTACYALGMPSPALWGTMSAVLNYIPFLGHIIGFSIIGLVALMSFGDLATAVVPPLVYAGLAFLEGQLITPMILARRLTLNPVAVFVALIFWGWLWQIPGMLLAVPMLAVCKIFCDNIRPLKPIGEFLGQ